MKKILPQLAIALVCLAAALLSWLLAAAVVRAAPALGLQAAPNARSSHQRPTAQGGGLAIVLACVAGALGLSWLQPASLSGLLASPVLLGAALLLAITGLLDDRWGLSRRTRLVVQGIAVLLLVPALWPDAQLVRLQPLTLFAALPALTAAVWWINLFNFMDGIDGIASMQLLFMLLGPLLLPGGPALDTSVCIVVAAVLGFLPWNWAPARLFMGDCGSLFLAFVILAFGVSTWAQGSVSLAAWLLLGAGFTVDATVTLLVRVCTRQPFAQPHRSHAYQRLSQRLGSHARATLCFAGLNLLLLAPAAWVQQQPATGPWVVALVHAALALAALWLGAGRAVASPAPADPSEAASAPASVNAP